MAVWVHPATGSQESVVQALPSLQLSGVPGVQSPFWQVSAPSQTVALAHEVPFVTAVLWQLPPVQESVVQGLPSSQVAAVVHGTQPGIAVCTQPVTASQVSVVHALPSSQLSGVPEAQVPDWQLSAPLHTFVSAHEVPFATAVCWHPATESQESVVQGLLSLQLSGLPGAQVPDWQVSVPLQTVASGQGVPLVTGVC
jgi:hypothetical protein